ncbi:hypothetical protein [Minwuia thermotolerans]|uniref:Uncharacterized protein n=1 Tax=Minwuia thermotolerans TaxID=2056226 RepID=A0A2M9FZ69_9PROT|nr:hypothetical protein [Minwuia thermotolerans]PJK28750.1 hypothetical protein CVT23_15560 [Minwuia thermotolerans]
MANGPKKNQSGGERRQGPSGPRRTSTGARHGSPGARGRGRGDDLIVPKDALTVWRDDGLTQFKFAVIEVDETRSNQKLEAVARARAEPVEAALTYAYLLDRPQSTIWWREWAGYELEDELLAAAVLARPAIRAKLDAFDPKDNEWGIEDIEDYRDVLVHAHHEEIDEADIRNGFRRWLQTLPPDARRLLAKDLKAWRRPK